MPDPIKFIYGVMSVMYFLVSVFPVPLIVGVEFKSWTGKVLTIHYISAFVVTVAFVVPAMAFDAQGAKVIGPADLSWLAYITPLVATHWVFQFTDYGMVPTRLYRSLGLWGGPSTLASIRNAHIRWREIRAYGVERFIREVRARVLDEDEKGNRLLYTEGDCWFVSVVDSTTGERHFIRVPPQTDRKPDVAAAIAWTFGMEGKEYRDSLKTEA